MNNQNLEGTDEPPTEPIPAAQTPPAPSAAAPVAATQPMPAVAAPQAANPSVDTQAAAATPAANAVPPTPPAPVASTSASRTPRRRLWWIAAGAAVALVAVGGIAFAVGRTSAPDIPSGVAGVSLGSTGADRHQGRNNRGTDNTAPDQVNPDAPGTGRTDGLPDAGTGSRHNGGGSLPQGDGKVHHNDQADLDIEDQRGDGSSVAVESVQTSVPGFVVLYTRDGTVVGQAPVSAGSQPVSVPLDDAMASGRHKLYGALWADDGDGVFNPATDSLVIDDWDGHDRHGGDYDDHLEDFVYEVQ